jgi:hypothetical protein
MVAMEVFGVAALMNKPFCSTLCKHKMFPFSGETLTRLKPPSGRQRRIAMHYAT